MYICANCGSPLSKNHILIDKRIPKMANGDNIIAPLCSGCSSRIPVQPTWCSIDTEQQVILITGLCGSGKSSIGKALEQMTGYIHIDGDAVSKRVNWDIRNGALEARSGYLVFDELLETIQVVLQLGFSVIATYVFSKEALEIFETKLSELGVKCSIIALQTEPDICIERDRSRSCWTAGEDFVLKWQKEQSDLANCEKITVIDNSHISLIETCDIILSTFHLKKDKV